MTEYYTVVIKNVLEQVTDRVGSFYTRDEADEILAYCKIYKSHLLDGIQHVKFCVVRSDVYSKDEWFAENARMLREQINNKLTFEEKEAIGK